jgi:hypothetical protein
LGTGWRKPASQTWWSSGGGSRRKLDSDAAIASAIEYARNQEFALVVWASDEGAQE